MFFLCLFILFFISTNHVKAIDEFKTIQKINYQIDQQGNASVDQEIQLINNLSEIYPTTYQLTISGPNITNINGTDNSGNIVQKVERQNESNIIFLKFNDTKLGKDQITKFNLNYTIPNLATQKGSIWEIPIPDNQNLKINDTNDITVFVPSSFNNLSFASFKPQNLIPLNNQTQLFFNNPHQKIFLIFGNYQLFDFTFKYFIQNSKNQSQTMEIAIPPENDSQKITYQNILPKPQNIKVDADGNWLAQYPLPSKGELEITVSGQAKIIPNIIKTKINTKDYLKEKDYWPISNPDIKKIATPLKTIKEIYDYVVNTLNYDYNAINASNRKGAINTLLSPTSSICTDFTDLFITLARANGIPAREIQGFAYTNNSKIKPINTNADILHAWPQYYDQNKESWVSVDPTWEKTTNGVDYFNDLDPNHFAFVYHGLESNQPLPPGAYKNQRNLKTVQVIFASQEISPKYDQLQITIPKTNFFQNNTVKIYNPNLNSLSDLKISIANLNWTQEINTLPPLSTIEIQLPTHSITQSFNPKNRHSQIIITSNNTPPYQIKSTNPKFYLALTIICGSIITFFGLGGIILTSNKSRQK